MHVAPTSMGGGWVGCVIGGYGGGYAQGGLPDISKSFFNFFLHESYICIFPMWVRTNPVLYFAQAT